MSAPPAHTISVIMPAFNAAEFLTRSLNPLLAMRDAGAIAELIVVDDGSTDGTAQRAGEMGCSVLRAARNAGPAAARNLGAGTATGSLLWFIDADVIAHAGGPRHIVAAFAPEEVVAVFGSYDDNPSAKDWLSRYKNLLHRFHHQQAAPEAATFWAGCGAVRADAFRAAGGFNAELYPQPSIEDIELGYRLRQLGRIVILPDLQGTHMKRWGIGNLLRTDIWARALPWSRLILQRKNLPDVLNVSRMERLRAAVAGALAMSVIAVLFAPGLWPLSVVAAALALGLNHALFQYFRRHGGPGFAIAAIAYHQVYYIYAAATFAWCMLEHRYHGNGNTPSQPRNGRP